MPKLRKTSAELLFASLFLLAGSALFGQAAAPWYADGLQKLGFKVFKAPQPLGEVSLQPLGGGTSSLSSQKGKVVLLNFWATWCPPCRAEMPSMEKLWQKNKDKAFSIVGVSVGESPQTVKDFVAKQGYTYPIFVDPAGELGAAFGARSIPTTYVLDKNGDAIAGKVGGAEYDSPEAVAFFAQMAAR